MELENYSLLCDFYELTMANGYFENDMKEVICYFDVFFRTIPDQGGYAVFAGLESIVKYIENLKFSSEDIDFLRQKKVFKEEFLEYLQNFKFSGDIYSMREGEVIFPMEPIITVRAKTIEAQLIETYFLVVFNHQSLIATKTSRIVRAARGKAVIEFGARRAHGESAALLGARSAYIAGAVGTSCTLAGLRYGIPVSGTMAHSWVQMFESEYEAFKVYCETYPNNATILIDTYNVLKSGIPNVIKVVKDVLWPRGIKKCAVRIDSGDITYLTRKARQMLDAAGLEDCRIVVSNSLDEKLIKDLILHGACIDSYGVGERLITAKSDAVFGGVYKLSAIENKGSITPKIKVSENEAKITNPGFKKTYRLFCKETKMALADLVCLHEEKLDETLDLEIFDPEFTWKRKIVSNYYFKELQVPIFINGKRVYELPTIEEIRNYCKESLEGFWDEVRRSTNPHKYYIDLSQKLWDLKQQMLKEWVEK